MQYHIDDSLDINKTANVNQVNSYTSQQSCFINSSEILSSNQPKYENQFNNIDDQHQQQ